MKFAVNRHQSENGQPDSNSRDSGLAVTEGSALKMGNHAPKIVAVTSGKGGVGKTNVVANLAVGLSELGKKVIVLDADFGLANIDVLLGLTPRYHLGHLLFSDKSLTDIMVQGPKGIRIIPASSGMQRMSELTSAQRNHLVKCFNALNEDTDYFIIDTAAGISRNVIHFLLAAQEVIVVSIPEPTAIVDAYAVIKIILTEDPEKQIQVLINSVENADHAHEVHCQINSVVKRFLNREIGYLGHVDQDSHVPQSVRSQVLVTQRYPNASSSRCFRNLARRLNQQEQSTQPQGGLVWDKLLNDWIN
ncbi:MAG: MinD/ParA family protein [Acidobacteriota bacterium]